MTDDAMQEMSAIEDRAIASLKDPLDLLPKSVRQSWASTPKFEQDTHLVGRGRMFLQGILGLDYRPNLIESVLRQVGPTGQVTIDLNSPGGVAMQGMMIYNMLNRHKGKVTVNVLGSAGSAAQLFSMAADEIYMGQGSQLFIHSAQGIFIGGERELRRGLEHIGRLNDDLEGILASRGNLSRGQAREIMNKETYMNADEAIESGLADAKMPAKTNTPRSKLQAGDAVQVSGEEPDLVEPNHDAQIAEMDSVLEETRQLRKVLNG